MLFAGPRDERARGVGETAWGPSVSGVRDVARVRSVRVASIYFPWRHRHVGTILLGPTCHWVGRIGTARSSCAWVALTCALTAERRARDRGGTGWAHGVPHGGVLFPGVFAQSCTHPGPPVSEHVVGAVSHVMA